MVAALGVLGTVAGLAPALGKIVEAVAPVIDRLIPDPNKKQEMMIALLDTLSKFDTGQLEVNKAEAANPHIFVAGWRPFIGWVLGVGVAYSFLLAPLVAGIVSIWKPGFTMPVVDGHLWELVFAMLGMGALRSFDKMRGTDTAAVQVSNPVAGRSLGDAIRDTRT